MDDTFVVAQISNLLYRRFPVGRASESNQAVVIGSNPQQVGNPAIQHSAALSPQRAGVRGGKVVALRKQGQLRHTTPHPHSLSPLRGEGGPLAQALENLRGSRRF